MQELKKDMYLEFHPDTFQVVRRTYDLDKPGAMSASIDILEEWIMKQDHFVKKDFDREFLERIILRSKGSVERAKERLDKYCTARNLFSTFFHSTVSAKEMPELECLHDAVLPKLTKDHYRIYILSNYGKSFGNGFYDNYYNRIVHYMEYLISRDYTRGIIIILDNRETNMFSMVKTMDPILVQQVFTIITDSFSISVQGIHIMSDSPLLGSFISIFKQILSAKLASRIFVHKDLESLHQHVEKDVLPEDYGGNEKSLKEIHYDWLDVVSSEEHIAHMKKMQEAITNEKYRRADKFNEQYLGMPGTFRTLSVD